MFQVLGSSVAALLHSAIHVSFMSGRLVNRLGLKKDVQADVSMPAPPLAPNGSGSAWLVEGRLGYVEVSLKGTKHVTQLFVARDLPADIILGVDFLRKTQMRLNFPESCVTFVSGGEELKLQFLSSKEVSDHQHEATSAARAYSSNF
ncbi:Aspartic peptidase domain [Trinorchestia longiramus]|nr:Aspartic peptidase domain [Trinorchestia longiramus]